MRFLLLAAAFGLATVAQAQDFTRQNDSRVSAALSGLGLDLDGRAWGAVPNAFEALYPNVNYDEWSLSGLQARAVAYIALLIAVDGDTAGVAAPAPQPIDLRAEARALASIALAQLGPPLPQAQREDVASHFVDAAGAAGEAGCSDLAANLASAARLVRSRGWVQNSLISGIEASIRRCD